MILNQKKFTQEERKVLADDVYDVVGAAMTVRKELPACLPEYIYQEAFQQVLEAKGLQPMKEYVHHPIFRGEPLKAFLRLDFVIPSPKGNIIVETKAIDELSKNERAQLFSYMVATGFPYGLLVNFATHPFPQIERYYFDPSDMTLTAF